MRKPVSRHDSRIGNKARRNGCPYSQDLIPHKYGQYCAPLTTGQRSIEMITLNGYKMRLINYTDGLNVLVKNPANASLSDAPTIGYEIMSVVSKSTIIIFCPAMLMFEPMILCAMAAEQVAGQTRLLLRNGYGSIGMRYKKVVESSQRLL